MSTTDPLSSYTHGLAATALDGTEEVYLVHPAGPSSAKTTTAAIAALAGAGAEILLPVTWNEPVGGTAVNNGNGAWALSPTTAGQPIFSDIIVPLAVGDRLEVYGVYTGVALNTLNGPCLGGTVASNFIACITYSVCGAPGSEGNVGFVQAAYGGAEFTSPSTDSSDDPADLYCSFVLLGTSGSPGNNPMSSGIATVRKGGAGLMKNLGLQAVSPFRIGYVSGTGPYALWNMAYKVTRGAAA